VRTKDVPNFLTTTRLLIALILMLYAGAVIFFSGSFVLENWRWHGALGCFTLFVLAWVSDGIDGWYARKFKAESDWGKKWDPRADKLLMFSYVLYLIVEWETGDAVWSWGMTIEYALCSVMFLRECGIDGVRERYGHHMFPVVTSGKGKTTAQGIALLLYGLMTIAQLPELIAWLALFLLTLATVLSLYSAYEMLVCWQNNQNDR